MRGAKSYAIFMCRLCRNLEYLSRYSEWLRVGRSWVRIQTGPGAHPFSCTEGTVYFPGLKKPGRGIDHPPHPTPKLKKEYIYTSIPLWDFVACFGVTFTFNFFNVLEAKD